MAFMEEKKRLGFLTLLIAVAGIVIAAIDAIVSVTYAVVPPEGSSTDFMDLVINGPIWWKINPIIVITIITLGIVAFLIGSDWKFAGNPIKSFYGFLRVALTFIIMSLSGLGDIISQTFIEIFSGHFPLNWLYMDWWWTRFMPIPAVIAFLGGHVYPTGIDMALGSILGIVLITLMWLHYYDRLNFMQMKTRILQLSALKH
jgi:hypothetical protein